MHSNYPILEFDPSPVAIIEPARVIQPMDVPEQCVICFFQEVIAKVVKEHNASVITSHRREDAGHPVYEIEINGKRLAFVHPGVGAPMAAGILEETIALGFKKFIACGSAGVLNREIAVGHIIVPSVAVRDEGTSYHYLPPAREVGASPEGVAAIEQVLKRRGVPYLIGKTWTTDAPYRETATQVQLRKSEGCIAVEMEAAAASGIRAAGTVEPRCARIYSGWRRMRA